MSHNKAIESINKLINCNKEQNKLLNKLISVILVEKLFGKKGGLYFLVNKGYYLIRYHRREKFRDSPFRFKDLKVGWEIKNDKDRKDKTLVLELDTGIWYEENIRLDYEEKVIRIGNKKKD